MCGLRTITSQIPDQAYFNGKHCLHGPLAATVPVTEVGMLTYLFKRLRRTSAAEMIDILVMS
jgi:hypothetical protein